MHLLRGVPGKQSADLLRTEPRVFRCSPSVVARTARTRASNASLVRPFSRTSSLHCSPRNVIAAIASGEDSSAGANAVTPRCDKYGSTMACASSSAAFSRAGEPRTLSRNQLRSLTSSDRPPRRSSRLISPAPAPIAWLLTKMIASAPGTVSRTRRTVLRILEAQSADTEYCNTILGSPSGENKTLLQPSSPDGPAVVRKLSNSPARNAEASFSNRCQSDASRRSSASSRRSVIMRCHTFRESSVPHTLRA